MEHTQSFYLNNDFRTCLANLMEHGLTAHPRGTTTKEIINYNITLTDPRNRVITFPERKTSTKYLLGEFVWYLIGSPDPTGILPYSKFWDNIRNPDGTVNSNYGNRLFGHFRGPGFAGQNQWKNTIELLQRDKDSRQAIMNIHIPPDRSPGIKDVPCTLTLQWFIRENRLHLIVNMRSNDVILGFTNDVFQFTMLQECLMLQLRETYPDLQLGHYYHNAGSMHIYDRHFEMANKIVANERAMDVSMIPMDVYDERTMLNLAYTEAQWTGAGQPEDYDFDQLESFKALTPYWQTLVKAFFTNDDAAMHAIFGQPDVDA
jgi:thymidylate synthase